MTLHNPWGIKLSAKDISQGWRFCYVEELMTARPIDAKFKVEGDRAWSTSGYPGRACEPVNLRVYTYITRTPVPQILPAPPWAKPKPSVPAEDDELDVLTKFLGGE
jgi:hypothetical protein